MLDSDPTQEMRDNPEISKFLDQLGGSMTKRQYKEPHWKVCQLSVGILPFLIQLTSPSKCHQRMCMQCCMPCFALV